MDIVAFDRGLLEATLARALRHGGDFAEVYVEDRDSISLRLEDGRIEQTSGGRETGAAVRLLPASARTTRTATSSTRRGCPRRPTPWLPPCRPATAAPRSCTWAPCAAPPGAPRRGAAGRGGHRAQGRAGARGRRGGPRRRAPRSPRSSSATATRGRRSSSPTHSATWSSTTARARASPHRSWPVAATSSRRATRRSAAAPGSSCWTRRIARADRGDGCAEGRHHARIRGRLRWAPCPSCWPTASAARCSTRPAATGSRPTPSPRAPASTPARWARSSRRRT